MGKIDRNKGEAHDLEEKKRRNREVLCGVLCVIVHQGTI